MPPLPYRIAARWDLDLLNADRPTARAVSGILIGAGLMAAAVGGGLGALLSGLFGVALEWIMWLMTPGWVAALFGSAISADLTLHRDTVGLPTFSRRLLTHWVVASVVVALPWVLLASPLLAWVEAHP